MYVSVMIVQGDLGTPDLFDMQESLASKETPCPGMGTCHHLQECKVKFVRTAKATGYNWIIATKRKEWNLYILITQHTECDTFASESFVSTWTATVCVYLYICPWGCVWVNGSRQILWRECGNKTTADLSKGTCAALPQPSYQWWSKYTDQVLE